MITQLVDIHTDAQGRLSGIVTDDGQTYGLTKTYSGYQSNAAYRALCGYVVQSAAADTSATIYRLRAVNVLADSTGIASTPHDPLNVQSVWLKGRYINFALVPKTKGNRHTYGFQVDSVRNAHIYLSLTHRQNGDPLAYDDIQYASLPLGSVKQLQHGDSINIAIQTFTRRQIWKFFYL
jgi:hypothetical protein